MSVGVAPIVLTIFNFAPIVADTLEQYEFCCAKTNILLDEYVGVMDEDNPVSEKDVEATTTDVE